MFFRSQLVVSLTLALATLLPPTRSSSLERRDPQGTSGGDYPQGDPFTTPDVACPHDQLTTGGNQVAVWWGENPNLSLQDVCNDYSYDIVNIVFITSFNWQQTGFPSMYLGPWAKPTTAAQEAQNATGLVDAAYLAAAVETCQQNNKTVLLTIGGAASKSNVTFNSTDDAAAAAKTLWNLFLGGQDYPDIRPFGPNVKFDGFDLDNQSGSSAYYADFVHYLKGYFETDGSKTYHMAATTRCGFPNPSLDLQTSWQLDYLYVVEFGNSSCESQGTGEANGAALNESLSYWMNSAYGSGTQVFLALPGSPAAVPADDSAAYVSGDNDVSDLYVLVMDTKLQYKCWNVFGGVALWDAFFASKNAYYQQVVSRTVDLQVQYDTWSPQSGEGPSGGTNPDDPDPGEGPFGGTNPDDPDPGEPGFDPPPPPPLQGGEPDNAPPGSDGGDSGE